MERQKSSAWWEGTEHIAPFPCSYDRTCPHDHTIHEHTLRSICCPIATDHSLQEDRWTRTESEHSQFSHHPETRTPLLQITFRNCAAVAIFTEPCW